MLWSFGRSWAKFSFVRLLTAAVIIRSASATQVIATKVHSPDSLFQSWFTKRNEIKCILCDIDGTFITSDHKVSEEAVSQIKELTENGVLFFPATGRTRQSVADVTGDALFRIYGKPLTSIPGVYQQGLTVYGRDGEIIWNKYLDNSIIKATEAFCEKHSLSLVAYAGDHIYTKVQTEDTLSITKYSEPLPKVFPRGLSELHESGIMPNKVIMMAGEQRLQGIRGAAEEALGSIAHLTSSVPGLLEVLPKGSSKGDGVRKLLSYYGISCDASIAFGDGENDMEMMRNVKYSVAMLNGKSSLKDISSAITKSNDDDGVAHVLNFFVKSIKGNI